MNVSLADRLTLALAGYKKKEIEEILNSKSEEETPEVETKLQEVVTDSEEDGSKSLESERLTSEIERLTSENERLKEVDKKNKELESQISDMQALARSKNLEDNKEAKAKEEGIIDIIRSYM